MKTENALLAFTWSGHEITVRALKPCCVVQGRPVCVLTIRVSPLLVEAYEFQHPFYRSSGRNSGMPDVWLPFRGIDGSRLWFDKKYREPLIEETWWEKCKSEKEHGRFGHPIYKLISDWLAKNQEWVGELPIEDYVEKASLLCPVME